MGVGNLRDIDLGAVALHALINAVTVLLAAVIGALELQPAGFHHPVGSFLSIKPNLVGNKESAQTRPDLPRGAVEQNPLLFAEFLDAHHILLRIRHQRRRSRHLELLAEQRVGALHGNRVERLDGLRLFALGRLHRGD